MNRKTIFCIIILFIAIGNISGQQLLFNFTEDQIDFWVNNLDEIDRTITYADIGHDYRYFSQIEDDFLEHFLNLLTSETIFEKDIFIKKYNDVIKNIPAKINHLFFEYPELNNNGYKHYLDFLIISSMIILESTKNGRIDIETFPNRNFDEININNIDKIKKLIHKNTLDIIYGNIDLIINCFLEIIIDDK